MDWKIIVLVVGQFLVIIANIGCFAIIKFNDLHHLGKDVIALKKSNSRFQKDIKNEVKTIAKEVKTISDSLIAIGARCEERHRV